MFFNEPSFFFSLTRISLICLLSFFLLDIKALISPKKKIFLILIMLWALLIIHSNYDFKLTIYFTSTILIPFITISTIDQKIEDVMIKYITIILIVSIFFYLSLYMYKNMFTILNIFFWNTSDILVDNKYYDLLTNTTNYIYHNGFRLGTRPLNPISLANFLSMIIIGSIFFLKDHPVKYFFFTIIFVIFINTGSKGPLLSLICSLIIIFLLFRKRFYITLMISFFIALLLQFGAEKYGSQKWDTISRLIEFTNPDSYDKSTNERKEVYKYFYSELKKNTLTNDFLVKCSFAKEEKSLKNCKFIGKSNFYHNLYMEIFSLGKFFFIIFISILIIPIYYLFKNYNHLKKSSINQYFYGLFFYFIIEAIFSGFLPREEYLFFLIAIIINQNNRLLLK